jgi:hypothetical protein
MHWLGGEGGYPIADKWGSLAAAGPRKQDNCYT